MQFRLAIIALALSALAQPALADNDKHGHWHGHWHGKGHGNDNAQGRGQAASPVYYVLPDRDRTTVYTYYRTEFAAGRCPPGLAKKHDRCVPPGQAIRVWTIGQPLPPSVVYYPLPSPLLGQLAPAPAGYQYVRVANDILLMGVGTRMITSALADLGGM